MRIFEAKMTENFFKLLSDTKSQMWGAQLNAQTDGRTTDETQSNQMKLKLSVSYKTTEDQGKGKSIEINQRKKQMYSYLTFQKP